MGLEDLFGGVNLTPAFTTSSDEPWFLQFRRCSNGPKKLPWNSEVLVAGSDFQCIMS
jgi:hypothetical protein